MKCSRVWIIGIALLAASLGAAKYRLDHPPLSQADKLFRQMAGQADEVRIIDTGIGVPLDDQMNPVKNPPLASLHGAQVQELEAIARLSDAPCFYAATNGSHGLRFYHHKKLIGGVNVVISPSFAALQSPAFIASPFDAENRAKSRSIHSRFIARFAAYLNRVAPTARPIRSQ